MAKSPIEHWVEFRPHKIQRALWKCPTRFAAVAAGRGSGKTELAKRKLVISLATPKPWKDPRYFYGAPTEGQAKRIAWDSLIDLIPDNWIAGEPNRSELRIQTIFGSELCVIGLDRPQRIEGVQWDGCVLDESCDLKPGVFDLNVLPTLLHRNGWCWRIGVPKRQGLSASEFRDFFEEAACGNNADASAYTWPSADILTPEQLAYARQHMDSKDFREQFGAEWQTAGGGIYYAFERTYNVRPCRYDPSKPLLIASDFNVDPMCWVLGHRYEGRIEWIDEIFLRNTNTPKTLNTLWERYQTHKGGFEFYGDAAGKARQTSASLSDYQLIMKDTRFVDAGRTVHYPLSNPPVLDRYAAMNALICNADGDRRMFVDPTCKNLIADIEACYYKPGTQDPAAGGDLTHMTDAVGYCVYKLFPIRVPLLWGTPKVSVSKGP